MKYLKKKREYPGLKKSVLTTKINERRRR